MVVNIQKILHNKELLTEKFNRLCEKHKNV